MGLYAPLFAPAGTFVRRPDQDPDAGVARPPPATPEQLGAGALVDLDPDDGRARMLRGRDGAALALMTETRQRGYPMTWDAARERASGARDRYYRRNGG